MTDEREMPLRAAIDFIKASLPLDESGHAIDCGYDRDGDCSCGSRPSLLRSTILESHWLAAHTKAAVDAAVAVEREAAAVRVEAVEAAADRLAASVILLAHEAHPTYASTSGWRGGIGGQAITQGCSIIDPPPDAMWTQADMPTSEAREWVRGRDVDFASLVVQLKADWSSALGFPARVVRDGGDS